jgi:hypothetical protein
VRIPVRTRAFSRAVKATRGVAEKVKAGIRSKFKR